MDKIELNKKPYILINKKINIINFERTYFLPYNEKDIYKLKLLINLLTYTTGVYPTESLYEKEKAKKLIISIDTTYSIRCNKVELIFNMRVPRENLCDDFSLDDAFNMFVESFTKPNVIDGKFNKNCFDREVSLFKNNLERAKKNYYQMNYDEFMSLYDSEEKTGMSIFKYLDEIDKIDEESLYEYFKEFMNSNYIDVVYGNTTKKRIIELYKNHNIYQTGKFEVDIDNYRVLTKKDNILREEKIKNYNQSALYQGYVVENYDLDKDLFYLYLLSDLLDGKESMILFDMFRIKNHLIYHYNFNIFNRNGGFVISLFMSKSNKEIIPNKLEEVFSVIKNKDVIKEKLSKIIKGLDYEEIYELDNDYIEIRRFYDKLLHALPGNREAKEFYKNIDIDKFIEFVDRIKLDTVYFVEGDKDE